MSKILVAYMYNATNVKKLMSEAYILWHEGN